MRFISTGIVFGSLFLASFAFAAEGKGGEKGASVVDPSYLALVSDQGLRTAVIAGRADLGMPDWRGYVPGHPMNDEEIADVVAWLASHRNQ